MRSHPNFVGYDAVAGKSNKRPPIVGLRESSVELMDHIGPLTMEDIHCEIPGSWLPVLNEIREWCGHHDMRFAASPFQYQIAKIYGDGFTIVLWRSKLKGTKTPYIKTAAEGPHRGQEADTAMRKISAMARPSKGLK